MHRPLMNGPRALAILALPSLLLLTPLANADGPPAKVDPPAWLLAPRTDASPSAKPTKVEPPAWLLEPRPGGTPSAKPAATAKAPPSVPASSAATERAREAPTVASASDPAPARSAEPQDPPPPPPAPVVPKPKVIELPSVLGPPPSSAERIARAKRFSAMREAQRADTERMTQGAASLRQAYGAQRKVELAWRDQAVEAREKGTWEGTKGLILVGIGLVAVGAGGIVLAEAPEGARGDTAVLVGATTMGAGGLLVLSGGLISLFEFTGRPTQREIDEVEPASSDSRSRSDAPPAPPPPSAASWSPTRPNFIRF